jgi:hypothetical protein
LNYNGRTYVPLAKVGELTGVSVVWNEQLKQVEIGKAKSQAPANLPDAPISGGVAGREGDVLKPDTQIIEEEEPGYKGVPDTADASYQWALVVGRKDMPPLLSEGWISEGMLFDIEGVLVNGTTTRNVIELSEGAFSKKKILLTLTLPEEFNHSKVGMVETTIDDIRIKNYYGNLFFNIEDLQDKFII